MSTVDSILALLDKWPKWKRLTALPEEVTALEARVKALEATLTGGKGEQCPRCRNLSFELLRTEPDRIFAELGGTRRHYQCRSCQFEESKLIT